MSEEGLGLGEEGRSCCPPVEDCDVGLVKGVAVDISTQTAPAGKGTKLWDLVQNVLYRRKVKWGKKRHEVVYVETVNSLSHLHFCLCGLVFLCQWSSNDLSWYWCVAKAPVLLFLSPCPVDIQVVITEMMRLDSRAGSGLTRDHMEIRPGWGKGTRWTWPTPDA